MMASEGFQITSIQAFIAVGDDGDEGIIGEMTGMGWMPFIAADMVRLEELKPRAIAIGRMTNKVVKLARFMVREDVETFVP
jgi:hypothetical protein